MKIFKNTLSCILILAVVLGVNNKSFVQATSMNQSKASVQFISGENSTLTLDYVTPISFGTHEAAVNDRVYQSESVLPYIQVTDARGTGGGWSVTAQASAFTKKVGGEELPQSSLPGTVITFNNGVPTSDCVSVAPEAVKNVVLVAGGDAAEVFVARENTGIGSWKDVWLEENITLHVPAGAATVGTHTSTITWTLSDVPGQ